MVGPSVSVCKKIAKKISDREVTIVIGIADHFSNGDRAHALADGCTRTKGLARKNDLEMCLERFI